MIYGPVNLYISDYVMDAIDVYDINYFMLKFYYTIQLNGDGTHDSNDASSKIKHN